MGRLWMDSFGRFTAWANRNIRHGELVMDVNLNSWCRCRCLRSCCCCFFCCCCTFQVHLPLHTFLFTSRTPLSALDRGVQPRPCHLPLPPCPHLTLFSLLSSQNSDSDGCTEVVAEFQSPFSIILMLRCHFELYLAQKHKLEDFADGGKMSIELL